MFRLFWLKFITLVSLVEVSFFANAGMLTGSIHI